MNKRSFQILIFLIILLAIILRFANYQNRWGLAIDQAYSAVIARHALETHKIPLLGPFSSAGPFQTGGEWYWIIMVGTLIYPFSVITPWVFMTSLYVLFVFLMIRFGTELIDKKFGLILGLFSAISTAQITQGTNLANQSPLALFSLFSIWSSVRFSRTKNPLYLFLLGFFVAFGAAIHLQGVGLFLLIIATLVFTKYFNLKGYIYLLLGLALPLLPILISDFSHNFFNFKNMLYYYLHDQYRISLDVLGRRWLTYLGVFWPASWNFIIGGNIIIGYLFGLGFLLTILKTILKKSIKTEWLIIYTSFLGMIFLLRYTRTPLFDSYLVFIHPFVLLISAFIMYNLIRRNLLLGLAAIVIVLGFSLQKDFAEITYSKINGTDLQTLEFEKILIDKYPKEKFAIYDYKRLTPIASFPLSLYLETDGKINDQGFKIGIATSGATLNATILLKSNSYVIFDLNSKSKKQLDNEEWSLVNPSAIYNETENWH